MRLVHKGGVWKLDPVEFGEPTPFVKVYRYVLEVSMKRSIVFIISLLLFFTLFLAACQPTPAEAPAEELATEEAAPICETLTIGAAGSETGKYAREGQDTRQGYIVWQ